jgi:hypothetical protein
VGGAAEALTPALREGRRSEGTRHPRRGGIVVAALLVDTLVIAVASVITSLQPAQVEVFPSQVFGLRGMIGRLHEYGVPFMGSVYSSGYSIHRSPTLAGR